MELNEDQIAGYNLAINMYSHLLLENKDVVLGLIESSYNKGFQEGIIYAQQQLIAVHQAEDEDREEYIPEEVAEVSTPKTPPQPTQSHPAEKFSDKLKGARR